ncbi:MAG TPA: hypothetical protein VK599_11220 [Streptosporangiaceae bacterium]|jgi:curved DNA-binding protein|nr:hypothetical protein [Streptosporangiaceae bacterium]
MWGIAFVGADIGGLVTLMSPQIAGPGGVALEAPLARVPERADHRRSGRAGEDLSDSKGRPGDLYAEVRIMVPAHPSRTERKLFEELAAESDFDPRSPQ